MVAASALSVLASVNAQAAGAALRLIWWGNPDRDRRTNEVVALYTSKTGAEVTPETYGWGDYWQKLATQAAGSNLPDVIQMATATSLNTPAVASLPRWMISSASN